MYGTGVLSRDVEACVYPDDCLCARSLLRSSGQSFHPSLKKRYLNIRARYIVLTGGSLVTFKVKTKRSFYPRQHHYPLFGAYVSYFCDEPKQH